MNRERLQGEDGRSRVPAGASPSDSRSAEGVLDLTIAQMEAASRLRAARRKAIPGRDIVAVGGGDLRSRSVAQPFPTDERPARIVRARLVLLCALLVGMSGGYLYVTQVLPERGGIEVSPPETRQTVISQAPIGSTYADG
ncbi:MAG: hypothetical protein MEP57_05890 [Microvirga sp.]|nr:hypothetical protein [Microvirga sp.]